MDSTIVHLIVARVLGVDAAEVHVRHECGGCSAGACFRVDLRSKPQSVFVKVSDNHVVCDTEAQGLRALVATNTIRVPHVYSVEREGNQSYLIMEYITMAHGESDYAALGAALGHLHTSRQSDCEDEMFGFDVDNFLGATPQKNTPRERDWTTFYKHHRLQYELDLLRTQGRCHDKTFLRRVERVIDSIDAFFDCGETIRPSLLHGDLWSGNWGFTPNKQPVIYDPACYFGHHEIELAMMTLFGDLPDAFFTAYDAIVPRAKCFDDRVPLYQLYHALNHYNLFGAGYQGMCEVMLSQLEKTIAKSIAHGA